ncbi:MAG: hypothetical protein IJ093_03305 [Bacilli bacterium]|nr:hypothetical protein [Bacilli bacterium]
MYEYKITINDRNYEFVYKDGKMHLLRNENGNFSLVNLNLIKTDDKERLLNYTIEAILEVVREKITEKIEHNEYKNTQEIQEDIKNMAASINVPELAGAIKNETIVNSSQAEKLAEDMNKVFAESNKTVEKKEEIVKENIDVRLETLFKENNITEYDINTNANIVVFYKNGVPHTINNTDGNRTIYEAILNEIELDKIASREDVDKAIEKSMEIAAEFQHSENKTIDVSSLENPAANVAENIKGYYNPSTMYGVNMDKAITDDQMLLADFGEGLTPINVANENNVADKKISVGTEKAIDNNGDVTAPTTTVKNENIQKDLNDEALDKKIADLLVKCLNNEELDSSEKEFIESYRDDSLFYKLSVKSQENMTQLLEYLDNLQVEYDEEMGIEKDKANVKTLGEMPKPNSNDTLSTLIIVLAAILTGILSLLLNTTF